MSTPKRLATALLCTAALAAGGILVLGRRPPARPDIVLVVWDACRADRTSAYGYARDTTPWLREFAAGGVLFRQCFSPSPWTPPAHASLFTGLLPRNHGLRQGRRDRIFPGVPLLAETLGAAGYETVGFTSSPFLSPSTGLSRGIGRMTPNYDERTGVGSTERLLDSVRAWLLERRNAPARGGRRPLFLLVNLMDAHLPRRPPPGDLPPASGAPFPPETVARAREVDKRRALRHVLGIEVLPPEVLAAMSEVYDDAVRNLDRRTGELFGMLSAAGILDGAFAAVAGDHGEHLGEHGIIDHLMSLRDPVLRIPLVVRWPGRLEGGRVEAAQVRLQDLYPTVLEAAGLPVPPPTGTDAVSLAENPLRGRLLEAEYARPDVYLPDARIWCPGQPESAFDLFRVSLFAAQDPPDRPGARKLVRRDRALPGWPSFIEKEELFDLAADPGETRDLLQEASPGDTEAAARLRALLEEHARE